MRVHSWDLALTWWRRSTLSLTLSFSTGVIIKYTSVDFKSFLKIRINRIATHSGSFQMRRRPPWWEESPHKSFQLPHTQLGGLSRSQATSGRAWYRQQKSTPPTLNIVFVIVAMIAITLVRLHWSCWRGSCLCENISGHESQSHWSSFSGMVMTMVIMIGKVMRMIMRVMRTARLVKMLLPKWWTSHFQVMRYKVGGGIQPHLDTRVSLSGSLCKNEIFICDN